MNKYNQFFDPETIRLKRQKNTIITIGILIVIIVFASISYVIWYKNTYNATISLLYTPASAIATLDNKPIKAGKTQVKPGTYKIVIKKNNFASYSSVITAEKNKNTSVMKVLLPNNSSTMDYYNQHPADQEINEAIGADNANNAANNLKNTFAISKILPLNGPTYSINYGASPDKPGKFAMFITYYGSGKDDALNAIKSLGYNPSDYQIVYTDGDTQPIP